MRPGTTDQPPTPPVAEPRQRWRLVFARDAPGGRPHRELADAWTEALRAAGLPLPRGEGRPRAPLAFAAPLPVDVVAERELADLWLARRLPIPDVRAAVSASMPAELRLVDLYDVWLGAPALAAALVAAEYRVEVGGVEASGLRRAAAQLLAATSLERERARGNGTVRYDLRPLVDDVRVEADPPPTVLWIRIRFHQERGAGRPEEVVAALGELAGGPIEARRTVRERLVLAGREGGGAPAGDRSS